MTNTALFSRLAEWLEANVLVSTVLSVLGAVTLVALAGLLAVVAARVLFRLLGRSGISSDRRIRKAGQEPGYRIVFGDVHGAGGYTIREQIETALVDHLGPFCFGAQFRLFRITGLKGRPEAGLLGVARKRLERTGADMIVWGARLNDQEDGLVLHGVSRGGTVIPGEATGFTLRLPGRTRAWSGEQMARAIAYLLAKRMQPALGRPEVFRAERVEGLGEHLDAILAAQEEGRLNLPEAPRREVERDFTSIALYLSQDTPRAAWLEKVITRRRNTLEALKELPDADARTEARLDLGEALLRQAEGRFDPVAVREATVHLNAVIETLRDHEVIRTVQRASDGLQRAKAMVETRRRFAVNFSA